MQRLTRAGIATASTGFGLLGFGMAMGNLELLVLATVPFLLLALSLAQRPASALAAQRTLSTRTPRRGDALDVDVVAHARGADLLELHAPVPDGFALEGGSNLSLHSRGRVATTRFRLRAHARGAHVLPALRAEQLDPRGIVAPHEAEVAPAETVTVAPRAFHADRLRRRGRARTLLPDREESRLGVGSTDFRELRDYLWGDPPKSINWKATARRLSARGGKGGETPLVNEYEKEGRTTVLLLLDGGADMRVGTSQETGLDHAVEATLAAARLFLARGARVGAATFGAASAPPAAPESGGGQMPSIERALSPGPPDPEATPTRALQLMERHLAGTRPIVLVVTRVTPRNAEALAELVRRLRVLMRERRRSAPVHVVDVRALGLVPTPTSGWDAARAVIEAEDEGAARAVAEAGARVVPWRPGEEDFRVALLRRHVA